MSGSKNCNEDALRRQENTEPEISILSRAENKSPEPKSQISQDKSELKHSELETIKINDRFSEPEPSISLRVFDPNITKLDLSSQNLLELDPSISNLIQLQGNLETKVLTFFYTGWPIKNKTTVRNWLSLFSFIRNFVYFFANSLNIPA